MKQFTTEDFKNICDAIEMMDDASQAFFNTETGEIVWLSDYMDSDEREEIADMIDESDAFLRLPEQWDINEYRMMENFIETVTDEIMQARLYRTIQGRGAFRRFKDMVWGTEWEQKWYDFRDNAYVDVAKEWCVENLPQYGEVDNKQ